MEHIIRILLGGSLIMNKKIKKKLAIVACTVMAIICTVNAGAAEVIEQEAEAGKYSSFKALDSNRTFPSHMVYLSTFNQNSEAINIIRFSVSGNESNYQIYSFKDYLKGNLISIDTSKTYKVMSGFNRANGASLGTCTERKFGIKGTYQKVRFKLSDFSSYFNSDGSHTITFTDDTYTYHFGLPEKVGDKIYYSSLMFFSGAAFTSVTPDKNGEIELYVSTQIGENTYFTTDFGITSSTSSLGGGGNSHSVLPICKGNAKTNKNTVSVEDATYIQLHLAGLLDEELSDLQKFNADVDNDEYITVKDATIIQLYLAKLL